MEKVFLRFFIRNGVAIHSFPGRRIQFQAIKSRKIESPGILCRNCIDAYPEEAVRQGLIALDDVFVHTGHIGQEFGITDARQLGLLLIRGQTGIIVLRLLLQAQQVALGLIRDAEPRREIAVSNSGDKLAASSLSPPPRGLGFTTNLSAPNVSLSKNTLARRPADG